MRSLFEASLEKLEPTLPVFEGETYPAKLRNGYLACKEILEKYVPELRFDQEEASQVMRKVHDWAYRNADKLAEVMDSEDPNLPAALQLELGSSTLVQQFILANFIQAAAWIGPWLSGEVAATVDRGGDGLGANKNWAEKDAEARLVIFATIVKMENDGQLQDIFNPKPKATDGLGAIQFTAGVVVLIVVLVSIFAAIILSYFYFSDRLEYGNELLKQMCQRAQKEKDRQTLDRCLEILHEVHVQDPVTKMSEAFSRLTTVALIAGGGYLAIRYVIPWASDVLASSKPRLASR